MKTFFRYKNLVAVLALPLLLSACGKGNSSSSWAASSIDSETGFAALTKGLDAFVAHDKIGFGYTRPSDHTKMTDDFEITYTPVEQPATSSSSASSASVQGRKLAAASSAPSINFSDPFTLGYTAGVSDETYPLQFLLNGLKDSVGDSILTGVIADFPSFGVKQGTSSPTYLTATGIKTYANLTAAYFDLSGASVLVSGINSLVQSTKGNESWAFPSDNRAKATFPSAIGSSLTYFVPLEEHLPALVGYLVDAMKSDVSDENTLKTTFTTSEPQKGNASSSSLFESPYVMSQSVSSFASLYNVVVTAIKKSVNFAQWTVINSSVLTPIKKFGDCLDSFSFNSETIFSEKGLDKISFSFEASANLDKLKTAYADSNPSGFVTALSGGGTLHALSGSAAAIPDPNPALSSYPEIPSIVLPQ